MTMAGPTEPQQRRSLDCLPMLESAKESTRKAKEAAHHWNLRLPQPQQTPNQKPKPQSTNQAPFARSCSGQRWCHFAPKVAANEFAIVGAAVRIERRVVLRCATTKFRFVETIFHIHTDMQTGAFPHE